MADSDVRASAKQRLTEEPEGVTARTGKAGGPRRRVVVEGDKPSTVDFAELPNSVLKHLLRSGSQAAWVEAVDRIRRKAERGDYGPVEDGEDGDESRDEESKPGREDSAKGNAEVSRGR